MNRLDRAVTRLKEAATRPAMAEQELEEVFEHVERGTPLNEKWSDAARAASAAARKARAKGGNWRQAARREYLRKGGLKQQRDKAASYDEYDKEKFGTLAQAKAGTRRHMRMDRVETKWSRRVDYPEDPGPAGWDLRSVHGRSAGKVRRKQKSGSFSRGAVREAELEEVFDYIEFGTPLNEKWSDAARAASAAARKARAKGGNWRKAATQAYYTTSTQHPSAKTSSVKMGTAKLKRVLRDDPKASPERLMKSVRAYTARRLEQRKTARAYALRGR